MNYVKAFNKPINKIVTRYVSSLTQDPGPGPEKNPFPSWKFIAFISFIRFYHQYVRQIERK